MVSDDYIMGFVEGEGCFSVAIQKYIDYKPRKTGRKNKRLKKALGFQVRPSFRINIVEKDQKVLYSIKEKLGVGQIRIQNREKCKNRQNICQYNVQTFSELLTIRDFFKNQVFYTTKKADFKIWCEILSIMETGKHNQKEGLLEIIGLRDGMNLIKGKTHKRETCTIKNMLETPEEHIFVHRTNNQTKL